MELCVGEKSGGTMFEVAKCSGRQCLYAEPMVCRVIRIVGNYRIGVRTVHRWRGVIG